MTIRRMDHVGIVVDDLADAVAFFVELGLELTKFHTPSTDGGDQRAPANASGIRHVAFAVDDIDAVVARLRTRGAELVGELGRYPDSYRAPTGSSSSWRSRLADRPPRRQPPRQG